MSSRYFASFMLLISIGFMCTELMAQVPSSGFRIEYDMNSQRFIENRYSALTRVNSGFFLHVGFDIVRKKRWHQIELSFGKNLSSSGQLVRFENLNPEIRYTFSKPLRESGMFIGAYWDGGSLLSFPVNRSWRGNNTISYTIWSSLGLDLSYHKSLSIFQKPFYLHTAISFLLMAYVIRPAYGIPYPTTFIEDGVFDFQRNGMGAATLKSGKLQSLNQFQHITFQGLFTLPLGQKKHELGIGYQFRFIQSKGLKKTSQLSNGITLLTKINF